MKDIYLLLGSNLGNREQHLKEASGLLASETGDLVRSSSVYETASWGKTDEPPYLNQVLHMRTNQEPAELMRIILSIEERSGRKRLEKWGSRTIDIDILFYSDQIINDPDLVIPHPYLHLRRFALTPLNELIPEFSHPVLDKSINELYCSLKDKLAVNKIKN